MFSVGNYANKFRLLYNPTHIQYHRMDPTQDDTRSVKQISGLAASFLAVSTRYLNVP
jgi:hypothetical protein